MTLKINKEECIGCLLCTTIAPDIFEMDSDSKAKVKKQKDSPEVKDAIESCPIGAIKND